ncbi:hypothetical protein [Myxosarcina sp. GI1(2024)]
MATPAIKTAAKDDIERIIESILLAFSTDPVVRWLYLATYQYFKHFPNFVRTIGDRALKEKTIYYTEGYSGAAFWYSPQSKPDDNALAALLQQTISQ